MTLQSLSTRVLKPLRHGAFAVAKRWPLPVPARLSDGSRMWVDLRSTVGQAIFVTGEFDAGVWRAIESRLYDGATFIDVGANVGYYSMLSSARVGCSGAVHCFEIDPRPLRCLRRNAASRPNVTVHESAIGDTVGTTTLVAAPDYGQSHIAIRSGDDFRGDGRPVRLITLDEWSRALDRRVAVVKIDIEGAEEFALRGGERFFAEHRPVVVCEDTEAECDTTPRPTRLDRLLRQMGYATRYAEGVYIPTLIAEPVS